jgi:hypothetical protein
MEKHKNDSAIVRLYPTFFMTRVAGYENARNAEKFAANTK